jgi:hypothetical protein
MLKATSVVSVLVFITMASGAIGQEVVDPKKVPITPAFEKQSAAECSAGSQNCKLICKFFDPPTGTRIGGHTECRTAHWWEDRMRQDQSALIKLQLDATHLTIIY